MFLQRALRLTMLVAAVTGPCGCYCEEDAWGLHADQVLRADSVAGSYPGYEVTGTPVGDRRSKLDALIGEVAVQRLSPQPPGASVIVTLEDLDTGRVEVRDIGFALDLLNSSGMGGASIGRPCDGSVPCDAMRYSVTIESDTGESFDVTLGVSARYLFCEGEVTGELDLNVVQP